jgi:hypothetical protein
VRVLPDVALTALLREVALLGPVLRTREIAGLLGLVLAFVAAGCGRDGLSLANAALLVVLES